MTTRKTVCIIRRRLLDVLDAWPDNSATHPAFEHVLLAYNELGRWLKEDAQGPPPEPPLEHHHD